MPKHLAAPLPTRTLPVPRTWVPPPTGTRVTAGWGRLTSPSPNVQALAAKRIARTARIVPRLPRPRRESWGAFYARERIAPYLDARVFTASERHLIERLCERLDSGDLDHGQPRLVADAIARREDVGAARTHGDLWNGNVMWTPGGAVLIDPAAQGGHAEEDLAALAVFGCPYYERILAAYNEASPLEDGWRERLTLHQAHIIMIHCAVFGRSYVPDAVAIARRYA